MAKTIHNNYLNKIKFMTFVVKQIKNYIYNKLIIIKKKAKFYTEC
jgi:hypothetical protein